MPSNLRPRTVAHFAEWLSQQPSYNTYAWDSTTTCLMSQYAISLKLRDANGHGILLIDILEDSDGDCSSGGAYNEICYHQPHTFGAAYQRALQWMKRPGHPLPRGPFALTASAAPVKIIPAAALAPAGH